MEKRKTKTAKTAGVIFPPPLIYLISVVAGALINILWPSRISGGLSLRIIFGIIAILLAVFIFVKAFKALEKAKTPIQPYKPTLKIVRAVPYSFSRNPVYLSFSLAQAGISLLLDNLWVLILLIPAILIINYGVILREERYLENKFGKEYANYKKSVRRWI